MGPSVVVVECDAQRRWLIEMLWVAGVVEEESCVGRLGRLKMVGDEDEDEGGKGNGFI
jgi:hypothetical protein